MQASVLTAVGATSASRRTTAFRRCYLTTVTLLPVFRNTYPGTETSLDNCNRIFRNMYPGTLVKLYPESISKLYPGTLVKLCPGIDQGSPHSICLRFVFPTQRLQGDRPSGSRRAMTKSGAASSAAATSRSSAPRKLEKRSANNQPTIASDPPRRRNRLSYDTDQSGHGSVVQLAATAAATTCTTGLKDRPAQWVAAYIVAEAGGRARVAGAGRGKPHASSDGPCGRASRGTTQTAIVRHFPFFPLPPALPFIMSMSCRSRAPGCIVPSFSS